MVEVASGPQRRLDSSAGLGELFPFLDGRIVAALDQADLDRL
jgi:hypothetical protein